MRRWLKFYRSALPANFFEDIERLEIAEVDKFRTEFDVIHSDVTPEDVMGNAFMRLWDLGYKLRRAWDEPNLEAKEWYVDEARRWIYVLTEPSQSNQVPLPPPTPTGIQESLRYFRNNAELAKHCANPNCANPYFFAHDPRDKYCDDECKEWAKLRSKRLSARKKRAKQKRGR